MAGTGGARGPAERLTVQGLDTAVSAPIAGSVLSRPVRSPPGLSGNRIVCRDGFRAKAADDPGDGFGCDGGSCCLLRGGPALAGHLRRHDALDDADLVRDTHLPVGTATLRGKYVVVCD